MTLQSPPPARGSDGQPFDQILAGLMETAHVAAFHPTSRQTPRLIESLITSERWQTLYYAMTINDSDPHSFLFSLVHAFADSDPQRAAILARAARLAITVDDYAAGLLESLAYPAARPVLLILDECDLPDIDRDLRTVLEQVATQLPDHCRLIFNGRALPRFPWLAWLAENRATLLRDSVPVSRDFYRYTDDSHRETAANPRSIQVRGLGLGSIAIDGEMAVHWEGHLPRLILFLALDRPAVTRAEICATFWAELGDEQAANVFYVTKRRLNKALGALDQEVLIGLGHTYRVNPALSLQYDVQDFVTALVQARHAPGPAQEAAWQQAIALYQQPFLSEYTDRWIVDRRRAYQSGYIEALSALAAIRLNEQRPEQALVLLQRAADDAPAREDVQRALIRIFVTLGRRSDAARQYRKLKRSLAVNGASPEPETERLYADLIAVS